jgi:hypothetical protein
MMDPKNWAPRPMYFIQDLSFDFFIGGLDAISILYLFQFWYGNDCCIQNQLSFA